MNLIHSLEEEQIKGNIVRFNPGDTVRVHVKVIEDAGKEFRFLRVWL